MREIKFRGKSEISIEELDEKELKHKNGWMYGAYVDGLIVGDVADMDYDYVSFLSWCSVSLKTVGQYTGLKDKNVVEIYEGDIVQGIDFSGDSILGFVEYDKGVYLVNCGDWNPALRGLNDDVEIIGNIHDNPELLEVAR